MHDLWRSYQTVALQHHDICRPADACGLVMLRQHGQADVCCSVGAWTLSVRDQSSTSCSGAHAARPLRDADRERARRTGARPRAQAALDGVEQERRAVARAGAGAEAQAGVRGSADGGPGQAPGQGAAPSAGPTGRLMLDLTHAGAATAPAPGRRPVWTDIVHVLLCLESTSPRSAGRQFTGSRTECSASEDWPSACSIGHAALGGPRVLSALHARPATDRAASAPGAGRRRGARASLVAARASWLGWDVAAYTQQSPREASYLGPQPAPWPAVLS